ncbi:hypothetical protein AMECASPLE_025245 [Ameca splendens]|uniref:Secreted protein n=1 Tax=Ameca splendens TaxID=208324 RepID=A0ABV0YSA5_9TELE
MIVSACVCVCVCVCVCERERARGRWIGGGVGGGPDSRSLCSLPHSALRIIEGEFGRCFPRVCVRHQSLKTNACRLDETQGFARRVYLLIIGKQRTRGETLED